MILTQNYNILKVLYLRKSCWNNHAGLELKNEDF